MFGFISRFVGDVCRCINQCHTGPWCVAARCRHLVNLQLHAVQVACWSNWILWRISSAVHTVNGCCGCCLCVFAFHCFPSFSIFATFIQVSLFVISLPFVSSVSSGLRKSFISSSHLFFGLPTGLFCLVHGAEAWVPFCCFLCPIVHLVAMHF